MPKLTAATAWFIGSTMPIEVYAIWQGDPGRRFTCYHEAFGRPGYKAEISGSGRRESFGMKDHKPQLRLIHLMIVIAWVAVAYAAMPLPSATIFAVTSFVF